MGGGEDPALDLASAVVEPCLDRLRAGVYEGDWIEPSRPLLRALIQGYSPRGVVALTDQAVRDHVVRLAAPRPLHVAREWSDTGQLAAAVDAALDEAKSLLQRR
jgi:hypothetical protein